MQLTCIFRLTAAAAFVLVVSTVQSQVHTTYLWHMDQPIYWPDASVANPFRFQRVKESHDLKFSGQNTYADGLAHPLNDLEEIFSKPDRVAAYQFRTKDAVSNMLWHPKAGAQVNMSGCVIDNINSLAQANQWGYFQGWNNNLIQARNWTTAGGKPRMDLTGFSYHHALSPLVSEAVLRKQIQAHKLVYAANFGNSPAYSKGYWPAEGSFSERNIKVLVEEGFEWTIVANSHIARTLTDYPLNFGTNGCNIDPPNQADRTFTTGNNWWNGQIDGRGGTFAAPYCYLPHQARYVDPQTGAESKIIAVPMCDLLSYKDGFAPMGLSDIQNYIAPFSNPSRPPLVLLSHDGDNAYGGGFSYYMEAVPGFISAAASAGYTPTTIQQYLQDYPVPQNDIVHIEDGSWVNAENDWGSPQFINWMWPQFNPATHEFDPNGWTTDIRNWAVLNAADHYAQMAEDLIGGVDMQKVVFPGPQSSNAELAWHFLLPGYNSGFMYYGEAIDMEVKPSLAGNKAIGYAQLTINANPGIDNTPPNLFIPQRYPYNPGGIGFGPNYGYQQFQNPSDFTIWTLGFDVNGIDSIALAYRVDDDGINPLNNDVNETYAGGTGVGSWQFLPMYSRIYPAENYFNDPQVDFFLMPEAISTQYFAKIEGLSEVLVDYYIVALDSYGNEIKTPIQHVYVGQSTPVNGGGGNNDYAVNWSPDNPALGETVTITVQGAGQGAKLHWGLHVDGLSFVRPIVDYRPDGTTLWPGSGAVESPFQGPDVDGNLTLVLGPFNNAAQVPQAIDFVIHFSNDTWDNNNGTDYHINFSGNSGPPVGISWTPPQPNKMDAITINIGGANQGGTLHWAVTTPQGPWTTPVAGHQPLGTLPFGTGTAVETLFSGPVNGTLSVNLGPFDNADQDVTGVNFVVRYANGVWDNNNGNDYFIPIAPAPVATCPTPTGLNSLVTGPNTVTLSWNAVPGALHLQLEGKRLNGPGQQQATIPGTFTSRNVAGLLPASNYGWRMRAVCADGVKSAYSSPNLFSTPAALNGSPEVNVWPNPASEKVQVQIRSLAVDHIPLKLYASDGRLVWQGTAGSMEVIEIPVSHLAAGVYHLRVEGDLQQMIHVMVR
jgi:hypothetical protein